jgi:hypothetical protein
MEIFMKDVLSSEIIGISIIILVFIRILIDIICYFCCNCGHCEDSEESYNKKNITLLEKKLENILKQNELLEKELVKKNLKLSDLNKIIDSDERFVKKLFLIKECAKV